MAQLRTEDFDNQEIFSIGKWNGDEYSAADLDAMVDAFGKVGFRPPVKLGHSDAEKFLKDEGLPAAGWVENLRRVGDKLFADFKKVPGKIADLIKAGAWRTKSCEIYWDIEDNGKKFPRVLKAVSLLGENIPAVSGLNDILALYTHKEGSPLHAYSDGDREFRVYCGCDGAIAAPSPYSYPRKSKEFSDYREADGMEERCGNCRYYMGTACSLVEGYIEANYLCDLFDARSTVLYDKDKDRRIKVEVFVDAKTYMIEERDDGFYVVMHGGKEFGPFKTKQEAQAKLDTEMGKKKEDMENQQGGVRMEDLEKKLQEERAKIQKDFEAKLDAAKAEIKKEYDAKQAAIEVEAQAKAKEASEAEKKALADRLHKLEAERRAEKRDAWIEAQKSAGHLAPKEEQRVRALMDALNEAKTVKYAKDGKTEEDTSPLKLFQEFIELRPSIFKELSTESEQEDAGEALDDPGQEANRLAQAKIAEHQKAGKTVKYADALKEVFKEDPDLLSRWQQASKQ